MPDRHHEVRAGEYVQLAELDLLGLVEVAGRPQHGEQGVAVALQLGALVRRDRVLHGQRVQAELRRRPPRSPSSVGPVQADPGHAAVFGQGLEGLFEVARLGARGRRQRRRRCQ